MNISDLEEQSRHINVNINFTLACLKKTMPYLVEKIKSKKYFIATMTMVGRPDDFYTIIDFTSKQIKHFHDFDEYCIKIYNSLENGLKC